MFKTCIIICLLFSVVSARDGFFYQYWAEFDSSVSNHTDGRWRVNDEFLSLHDTFGKRGEARANGLVLVNVPQDLFNIEAAGVVLELWGGHPKTADKRFILNGKETYAVPSNGARQGHCVYSYPYIPVKVEQMVTGINALQFACNRGETFWGHFIMDNVAVRTWLKNSHPDITATGLGDIDAAVKLAHDGKILRDKTVLCLDIADSLLEKIQSVDYYGFYLDYDDNGNQQELDWHGFTHKRKPVNHLGTAAVPPFSVEWQTGMVPTQSTPVKLRAVLHFKNGLKYRTPASGGFEFEHTRPAVKLYKPELPVPYWSRAGRQKQAVVYVPENLDGLFKAQLWVKVWDGGAGNVDTPFQINGHAYDIISGRAIHDVVFTRVAVDISHLKPGKNVMTLLSDTRHHGIEVLLPGPCLGLRFKDNEQ